MESVLCIVHNEIFTQQMISNKYFLKQFLFLFKYLYTVKLVASKHACCRSFWTKNTHNLLQQQYDCLNNIKNKNVFYAF